VSRFVEEIAAGLPMRRFFFDFSERWIYVLGVGIAGAKMLKVGGHGL
jgi:hypothetical protein